MKILDILNSPWAIQPEKLLEIQALYATHLRGEKIDIKAIEAQLGQPLANERNSYTVIDGVAVLPILGVIARRMNIFMQISGGTSIELMKRDFNAALNDPSAHAIVQHISSPGGSIEGIQQYAAMVYAARGKKRIVTLGDDNMGSAAMWIGAAAQERYVADETTIIGSLGIIMNHTDVSKQEEKLGIKTTPIYSGKYKGVASEYGPLTAEGEAHMKALTDHVYSVMINDLAMFYGIKPETVLKNMAEAQLFLGQNAVDSGLVSGVFTLDELIAKLNAGTKPAQRFSLAAGVAAQADALVQSDSKGTQKMITREFLNANHADLVEAIRLEGYQRGNAEGRLAGADAERARILAVEGQLITGHEALIAGLKFDGKTTGPEAAVAVLAAEKTLRGTALAKLRADAPDPATAPAAPAGAQVKKEPKADSAEAFDAAIEKSVSVGLSRGKAIVKAARDFPAAHAAWIDLRNAA